jgi:hypothetical protein
MQQKCSMQLSSGFKLLYEWFLTCHLQRRTVLQNISNHLLNKCHILHNPAVRNPTVARKYLLITVFLFLLLMPSVTNKHICKHTHLLENALACFCLHINQTHVIGLQLHLGCLPDDKVKQWSFVCRILVSCSWI